MGGWLGGLVGGGGGIGLRELQPRYLQYVPGAGLCGLCARGQGPTVTRTGAVEAGTRAVDVGWKLQVGWRGVQGRNCSRGREGQVVE